MAAFQPTLAPPGRLVRLGVVLDARNPGGRTAEVARMCDRAGIGAVWVDDSVPPGLPPPPTEALATLAALAPSTSRARLGAMLVAGRRPAPLLAATATTLAAQVGDRLEIAFLTGGEVRADVDEFLAGLDRTAPRPTVAVEAGEPGRLDPEWLDWLAGVADDVLLTVADVDRVAQAARELRAACATAGRESGSLGVAVRLPVSIGRTMAEAAARWDAEPAFAGLGPPARAGVFGTLEQCQQRVIGLAHAGVTDLRCVLPNAADIHDVIAQVTAMTVGTVAKLAAGAPRSPSPPPPAGWGGRSRFPRPDQP